MSIPTLRLKKNEDRRLRMGHVWIYSNEIDTKTTPLKSFIPGAEVQVVAHNGTPLGVAYINPHSLIAGRLFTRNPDERLTVDFFTHRIKRALELRDRLYDKPYYRLIFGESDGLPGLIVDRFNEVLSVQINTAGMDKQTDNIVSALRTCIPKTQSILLKNDTKQRQQEGLEQFTKEAYGTPAETVFVEENGVSFHAPLWKGQKTGWFYDHRQNRSRLKDYVANQNVLDVFSYLGAFGIQAATFGAKKVTCIDSSELSSGWIKENARLNQVQDKIDVMTEDAFVALKELAAKKQEFDLIILDPPAFIKKQKDIKEGLIAYQRINESALKLLKPDGILVSCSCSMHLSEEDLLQTLRRASFRAQCELQILERGHQGADHPVHIAISETNYLKMIIARRV